MSYGETILGSILTGAMVASGWYVTYRIDLKKKENGCKDAQRALLNAIHSELTAILDLYNLEIRDNINKHKDGNPYGWRMPIFGDYTTVYDGNTTTIGLLGTAETRDAIITAYSCTKSMIDTFKMNNVLLNEYSHRLELKCTNTNDEMDALIKQKFSDSCNYAPLLVKKAKETVEKITRAIDCISTELK